MMRMCLLFVSISLPRATCVDSQALRSAGDLEFTRRLSRTKPIAGARCSQGAGRTAGAAGSGAPQLLGRHARRSAKRQATIDGAAPRRKNGLHERTYDEPEE
jgi:hypothetical protein